MVAAWSRSWWCAGLREHVQQHLLFPALARICPTEVVGVSVLDDLAGPLLLAANHTSHLDTPCLLAALPAALRRRTVVAAAADYFFRNPLLGVAVAASINAFPFPRQGQSAAALRACRQLSAAGWSLLLFPEGTRSPDGRLGVFRPGIGRLAVDLGVPVVPVRLDGLARVLPKGRHWPRRGRARVSFGPPLRFGHETAPRVAARTIEAAVRELGPPRVAPAEGRLAGRLPC
jgi:long-chain acyl-CoA synthetase